MADAEHTFTILAVDDSADNRALVCATLEDEGYAVACAASGEEALRLFAELAPGLVLMDVRMPGLDGFATCERLRGLPGGPAVPVIFLTALRDVETFDKAQRAGADDFLVKPIRPAELVMRIQAALKLARAGAELKDTYDVIRRQRDDLMRLQLQKEALTALVVHDLKNPATAIDLYAQALLADRALNDGAKNGLTEIRREVRALLRLILNLLDISRAEEGELVARKTRLDLETLMGSVVQTFEARARDAGVTLRYTSALPCVDADADLLPRVLENLLDNAIRHAPESSQVAISAASFPGAVEIRVADAGPGIAPADRERVFDRYVRLDTAGRANTRSGRGLGLAFCKLAVAAHQGTIWVEDAQPGAVFCVRLPHDGC